MEKVQLAYAASKETNKVVMMVYKKTSAIVRSPDGDFFDIGSSVLHEDIQVWYFISVARP